MSMQDDEEYKVQKGEHSSQSWGEVEKGVKGRIQNSIDPTMSREEFMQKHKDNEKKLSLVRRGIDINPDTLHKRSESEYFWIYCLLTINIIDIDKKVREIMKEGGLTEKEIEFYLGQRKQAIKEGDNFELKRYMDKDSNSSTINFLAEKVDAIAWDFYGAIKSQDERKKKECWGSLKLLLMYTKDHLKEIEFPREHFGNDSPRNLTEDMALEYVSYVVREIQRMKDGDI